MDAELLSKIPTVRAFFSIEPEKELNADTRLLLETMTEVTLEAGQDIVTYGADCADGMYILLDGEAEVISADGKIVNLLGAGEFIGELGLITEGTRNATVRAKGTVRCANISRDLFEELAQRNRRFYGIFMRMLYRKTTQLVSEQVRIKTDLEIATRIQNGLLEDDFSAFNALPDLSVYARVKPAREVGGDFYDVFWIGEHRLCFLVADVSGKGVSGALITMLAKTHLKSFASLDLPLAEVVSRANNQLCYKNEANMFVTAFVCVLDLETNELTWVNAGHNKPFIREPDGSFHMLPCRANLVLGLMEDVRYRAYTMPFPRGTAIYLYTDGVTEAANPAEELFGDERCEAALNATVQQPIVPEELIEAMFREVEAFADGAEQADDITMLCLTRSDFGPETEGSEP